MEPVKVQFNKNSEERRKRRTKFLFVALLACAIFLAAAIAVLRMPSLQVSRLTVQGTEAMDPVEITEMARRDIAGTYAWVIPRGNILIFSKRALRQALSEQFPGIESIEVLFADRDEITVNIVEKLPRYVWCRDSAECYFVDKKGVMYRTAPVFSRGVYVLFSGNTKDVPPVAIKESFMLADQFERVDKLVQSLDSYPAQVVSVRVTPDKDLAIGIEKIKNDTLAADSELLVTMDASGEAVAQGLDTLLSDKGFANALVSRGKDLESIDLRFPSKIYYKFRNGGTIPATASEMPRP